MTDYSFAAATGHVIPEGDSTNPSIGPDSWRMLRSSILDGNEDLAISIAESMMADCDPLQIVEEGIRPALKEIGDKLANDALFIPDLVLACEAAKAVTAMLTPRLVERAPHRSIGKVVMGVVEGDTHDIGKNIVKAMLTASGFSVVDLGVNVTVARFVQAVKLERPCIAAVSASTSITGAGIGRVTEAMRQAGVRNDVRMLIGGAGVYPHDVEKYGADDFGDDALEAVQAARGLVDGGA